MRANSAAVELDIDLRREDTDSIASPEGFGTGVVVPVSTAIGAATDAAAVDGGRSSPA